MQQQQLLPLPEGLPGFEEALATLDEIILTIYKALENGAYKVSAYRDAEAPNEILDAGFAASILRFHSSKVIKNIGTDFELEDWIEDSITFMGMSFYYKKYHVRILKGPHGELPGCGDSVKKKGFYNQLPSLYLIGTETIESICNVIVLWNFGPAYNLEQLRLALPAKGASGAEHVSAYWNKPMPYPAGMMQTLPSSAPSDDGMDKIVKPQTLPMPPQEDEGKTNVR